MRALALVGLLPACGGGLSHNASGPPVAVSGQAFVFGPGGDTLAGGQLSVAEAPDAVVGTVAAAGTFELMVPSGGECSFVLHKDGYHETQTAVLPVGPGGLRQVGFQVPADSTYDLLASLVHLKPDPQRCQIATTVSAAGTAPYGGSGLGEPGATVTIEPPLPADNGPLYFQFAPGGLVYPDPKLGATTIDGGVLYTNVPPGEYRLEAHKTGHQFTAVRLRCVAGRLINAAPPFGLQGQ